MADEPQDQNTQTPASDDVSYLRSELQKVISQRDKAKAEAKSLREQASLTDDERVKLEELTKAAAEAEERKKLEAGDFEAAKTAILKEKEAAELKAQAAEQRYARKVVESAFQGATDLFGPSGLTTLTPEFAYAGMSSHVEYVPGQNGAADRIVVRGLDGEVIRTSGGDPAPFQEGMRQLLDQWPGKDQLLRAGQKAGSGSTGGTGDAALPVDRAELAQRAARGDKAALEAFRSSQPANRTVFGEYWDRLDAEKTAAK